MKARAAAAACLGVMLWSGGAEKAQAMEIQRVVSPGGIEAWFVEDHAVPIVTLKAVWVGGASTEPPGKAGLSHMLAGLLDEGAGPLDSAAFQERLADDNIRLRFQARRDSVGVTLRTLSENREEAFDLLRLALGAPRFDAAPVARVRGQVLAGLKSAAQNPDRVASRAWFAEAFGDHAYGRPVEGTEDTIAAITAADLRGWHVRALARDNLKVVAVGAMEAPALAAALDAVFGALPESARLPEIAETAIAPGPRTLVLRRDNPQTVMVFGNNAIKRGDPDFIPAYVMNYILGGGGFSSWLTEEVREKRGLAYSVSSALYPLEHAGLFLGRAATQNARAAFSLDTIRAGIRRMARQGVTDRELRDAKLHLTGAYALRFASGASIAAQLAGIRLDGLGIDYVDRRNGLIEAVSRADVQRAAQRVLDPARMVVVMVGDPAAPSLSAPGTE